MSKRGAGCTRLQTVRSSFRNSCDAYETWLVVSFAVYRVFEDGEQYRAFFISESKVVVAIEALDRFGQSGRLRHRHRWGRLDIQLWWLLLLVGSVAVLVAGLFVGSLAVALLGLSNLLLSGLTARAFVRGW